jgi:phospholipase/carboxylesterase
LRHKERLAGLLALSGYLPLASTTAAERSEQNREIPIFMAHGVQDPVIVISRARESRDTLSALGYHVTWHEYSMPHSVCPEEIDDISTWLRSVLPA